MKRIFGWLLVLVALGICARATTIKPMSIEDLTRAANNIIEAQALDSWSQWNSEHTIIFTYTRLTVFKGLKGNTAQQIVVKQPGGVVPPYGQRVPGVRQFQPGESVVLFLRPSAARDGSYVVVGLMQGNFRMYRAAGGALAVSNGIAGVSEVRNNSVRVFNGIGISLQQLESRVVGVPAQ